MSGPVGKFICKCATKLMIKGHYIQALNAYNAALVYLEFKQEEYVNYLLYNVKISQYLRNDLGSCYMGIGQLYEILFGKYEEAAMYFQKAESTFQDEQKKLFARIAGLEVLRHIPGSEDPEKELQNMLSQNTDAMVVNSIMCHF